MTPEQIGALCDRAGMGRDEPLRELVVAMAEDQRGLRQLLSSLQSAPPPQVLTPEAERKLCDRLAQNASHAARGAIWDAHKRVDRTFTLGLATGIVAMVLAGVGGGYWWGWSAAAGRDIDTQSTLGTMPSGAAADWAKIVRLNPPPSAWTPKPYKSADGSMAIEMPLRLTPIPPTAAAAQR
jgi:hypothetical protein